RAGVNSKLFGNDADTGPPRSRQSPTDSLFQCRSDWGTPEAFTLTPGPRKASTASFLNHRPLELREHAHHLKHRLPGGCRGVEPLLAQEQLDLPPRLATAQGDLLFVALFAATSVVAIIEAIRRLR